MQLEKKRKRIYIPNGSFGYMKSIQNELYNFELPQEWRSTGRYKTVNNGLPRVGGYLLSFVKSHFFAMIDPLAHQCRVVQ
jgi:hypothetical protein